MLSIILQEIHTFKTLVITRILPTTIALRLDTIWKSGGESNQDVEQNLLSEKTLLVDHQRQRGWVQLLTTSTAILKFELAAKLP